MASHESWWKNVIGSVVDDPEQIEKYWHRGWVRQDDWGPRENREESLRRVERKAKMFENGGPMGLFPKTSKFYADSVSAVKKGMKSYDDIDEKYQQYLLKKSGSKETFSGPDYEYFRNELKKSEE